MPWTSENYPASMKNLAPAVREKAIEIANALLKEGNEEGRAIAIGTAKAEEWAQNRHESAEHTREQTGAQAHEQKAGHADQHRSRH